MRPPVFGDPVLGLLHESVGRCHDGKGATFEFSGVDQAEKE